jgi:small GTP-binding protein
MKNTINRKLYSLTILLMGYKNTGKTTLINSIVAPKMKTTEYIPTIGAELKTGLIEKIFNNLKIIIKIKFMELSGQSRFKSIISPKIVMKGDIIIFVYNSNDSKSFDKLKDIYYNCFDYDKPKPLCFLLCNKIDIIGEKENIDLKEEVLEFCDENNIMFCHCTNFLENCSNFSSSNNKENNNIFKNLLIENIIPTYFKYKGIDPFSDEEN